MVEVSEGINKEDLVLLSPYRQIYLKVGHLYLAVAVEDNILTIEYAQNTGKRNSGDWQKAICDLAVEKKYIAVRWGTAESNKIVQNIAQKWGMKIVKIVPNYYSTGESCIMYERTVEDYLKEINK